MRDNRILGHPFLFPESFIVELVFGFILAVNPNWVNIKTYSNTYTYYDKLICYTLSFVNEHASRLFYLNS